MSKDDSGIGITCVCGKRYSSPRQRFHTCASCKHVWDLRPDEPKHLTKLAKQLRDVEPKPFVLTWPN